MCAKFQGENIHTKKDMRIIPTCVFGRIEYVFSNESFGLEIWHTCYQQKFDGKKQFFSPWEGVKVGSSESFPHNNTCW